ncbi:MAG TPA: serine/threonine-protein kinase [Polyangiaceae bacterium]|nr:serine/threonine-protein kinase [Polyangiaceae bacterium]
MAKVKLLDPSDPRRRLDRYELIGEIATGGMATVFLARRGGVGGFQRFVAIKRLHPHLQNEPEFVEMFLDEARLAALIHHPNVVPILEVGENETGYYLVMEYVEGDTLSRIVARTMSLGQLPPRHVVLRIVLDTLAGLHAAHELRDDRGQMLGLVHRDVSPQNVLVGVDGTARITDFGVARASSRLTSTAHGKLKGKLAYMAPEQTRGDELDRRTDLFAMGIILWEVLCARRLFKADSEAATLQRILVEPIRPPSDVLAGIPKAFDHVVLRALDRDQTKRFQTAADMADALEAAARDAAREHVTEAGLASPREVASFVQQILGQEIGAQRESVRAWLAQSDSGQPVVIQGGPASPRTPSGEPPPGSDPQKVVVPRFEVAADVTMRFALEQKKAELPRPVPPPRSDPSSSRPPPAPKSDAPAPPPSSKGPPPRVPPPKQSTPTLLGQGPLPRREDDGDSGSYRPPAMSEDVGDDCETVAKPATNHPPPIQPAVKTARGLFAEPILAEARAKLEQEQGGVRSTNGSSNGAASASLAGSAIIKTPRMPMPADQLVGDARVQISPAAGRPPIVEAIPVGSGRPNPRTLVSASGDMASGGLTPGSMTLPNDGTAPRSDSYQDATVVHSVPKSGAAKYLIVFAAVLLVGATLLLFLKVGPGSDSAKSNAKKPTETATAAKTDAPGGTQTATATVTSAAPTATASAEPAPSADATSKPAGDGKVRHSGGGKSGGTAATATATSAKTSAPTASPTGGGEDLTNPYR